MGTATKPVRLYAHDQGSLKLLAATQNCTPADIVHNALQEYVERHRERLAASFRQAQDALAAGDLDSLATLFEQGAESRARAAAEQVRSLRPPK